MHENCQVAHIICALGFSLEVGSRNLQHVCTKESGADCSTGVVEGILFHTVGSRILLCTCLEAKAYCIHDKGILAL